MYSPARKAISSVTDLAWKLGAGMMLLVNVAKVENAKLCTVDKVKTSPRASHIQSGPVVGFHLISTWYPPSIHISFGISLWNPKAFLLCIHIHPSFHPTSGTIHDVVDMSTGRADHESWWMPLHIPRGYFLGYKSSRLETPATLSHHFFSTFKSYPTHSSFLPYKFNHLTFHHASRR